MGMMYMEWILNMTVWLFTLGILLALPALLFVLLRRYRKSAIIVSLLCALFLFCAAAWVAQHPFRRCPETLEVYMTEDRWQDILSVTRPHNIQPVFPWRITVERADETDLYWRVDWFPGGTSRTGLTPDGYDPVHGISPW